MIKLEIKINKEIQDFKENIYFGLSLRQFFFSFLACLTATILYFSLRSQIDIEILSWLCILGTIPFGILGFVTYNGMSAEKIIKAYIDSVILTPKKLTFKPYNFYYEIIQSLKRGDL